MAEEALSTLLRGATQVDLELPKGSPVVDLPAFARVGVDLARLVLWFIAVATLILIGLIILEEFAGSGGMSSSIAATLERVSSHPLDMHSEADVANYQKVVELTERLITTTESIKQGAREFVLKVFQLVLGSILLPILTALLGYIFGTQQASGRDNKA